MSLRNAAVSFVDRCASEDVNIIHEGLNGTGYMCVDTDYETDIDAAKVMEVVDDKDLYFEIASDICCGGLAALVRNFFEEQPKETLAVIVNDEDGTGDISDNRFIQAVCDGVDDTATQVFMKNLIEAYEMPEEINQEFCEECGTSENLVEDAYTINMSGQVEPIVLCHRCMDIEELGL